jgi:hypothetical protein
MAHQSWRACQVLVSHWLPHSVSWTTAVSMASPPRLWDPTTSHRQSTFATSSPFLWNRPTPSRLDSRFGAMGASRGAADVAGNAMIPSLQQRPPEAPTVSCDSASLPESGSLVSMQASRRSVGYPMILQPQHLSRDYSIPHERSSHGSSRSLCFAQAFVSSNLIGALPLKLSQSTDMVILSKFQVFLRLHIEAFAATDEDVSSRIRGRNKQIHLHQVGVRCRHCAHIPANQRLPGAVYFPSSTSKTCARHICNADSAPKCPNRPRTCLRN